MKSKDPTEEQKRFARAYLHNDPHFAEEKETLIEAIEVECVPCSIKILKEYETPKTLDEYCEDRKNLSCPQCKEPYLVSPIEGKQNKVMKSLYTSRRMANKNFRKIQRIKKYYTG